MPRWKHIGSTGVLKPGQCQNDVMLTGGAPEAPVAGDERLIIQGTNQQLGIMYAERWIPAQGNWGVVPMPPGVVLWDHTVNPNAPQGPIALAPASIVNQIIAVGGVPIMGFDFMWGHDITLYAPILRYVQHQERATGEQYMTPMNPSPAARNCQAIQWGIQVNQWRSVFVENGWAWELPSLFSLLSGRLRENVIGCSIELNLLVALKSFPSHGKGAELRRGTALQIV
ncbi:hypothetical protein B0H11DRAFT_1940151 [Mycena galericulata]|nr:hypothetical protein B0H11DRAFT_1940151 [Mycena galericulata]